MRRRLNKHAAALLPLLALLFILHGLSGRAYAETYVSGNITRNTTWTLAGSPYIVTGNITVRYSTYNSATAVLTIEPGAEVRFEPGTGIKIGYNNSSQKYYGALDARGTESAPIVFTSNAAAPAPGDWKGIYFQTCTNDNLTVLEHCVVEYGGDIYNSNLYFQKASPAVKNSIIRYGSGHGVFLNSSAPIIAGNTVAANALDGIYGDDNSAAAISNNSMIDNGGAVLNIHANRVRQTVGNSGTGNAQNAIVVRGGNVLSSGIWANQNLPYVVTGNITVRYSTYNSATAVLTIEPGVEVRFEPGTGIKIGYNNSSQKYYGALDARGTESAPIVFTSNAAAPAPGDWKGIYFQTCTNDNLTVLEHCVVEYGGDIYNSNLYFQKASPAVKNSIIRYGSGHGVYPEQFRADHRRQYRRRQCSGRNLRR